MEHLNTTARPLMSINEAKLLLEDEYSCFELVKDRQVLLLSPRYMNDINKGLLELLKMQLGIYMEQFHGVPVAYTTVQREQENAMTVSDQPHLHLSVQTELIIFKPQPGRQVRAVINKLGRDYVGCLVHNYFNASVLEPEASEGAPQEQDWSKLQLSDSVVLSIAEVYPQNKGLSLLCKLVCIESSGEMHEDENGEMFPEFPTSTSFEEGLQDDTLASSQSIEITDERTSSRKKKKRKSTHVETEESDLLDSTLEASQRIEIMDEVISSKKKKKRKSMKVEPDSLPSSQSVEIIDEVTPSTKKKKRKSIIKLERESPDAPDSTKTKKRKRQHSDTNDSGIADPGTDLSDSLTSTRSCENGLKKSKKRKLLSSAGYSLNDSFDLNSSVASSQETKVHKKKKKIKSSQSE